MADAHRNAVLIAGAGPVGLTAGLALLRRGVAVIVLEAEPALDTAPRGSTFHPPTLEMLQDLGVGDRLITDGLRVDRFQYRERSAGVVAEFDLGLLRGDTPYPFRLQCPQHRLAELILGEIEASPWADVRFGHRVVGVTQDADGITARVETASGPREISGPYLLGADGASSTVRRQLGVEFEELTYPVRYLVLGTTFDFATHFPDLADVAYIFDPEEYMVLLRVPGLWRVLFACHAEESDEAALEGRSVERRLRRFVGHAATFDVHHKTIFRVHQRVASTFRRGCVLLLGDAAHINSPIGGMGMNGGIHDAWFLADCLARVLRGEASETVLDSWAEVRRRIALDVVRAETHRTTETLGRTGAAIRAQRNDEFARLAADPTLARQYLLRSSMIAAVRGHP